MQMSLEGHSPKGLPQVLRRLERVAKKKRCPMPRAEVVAKVMDEFPGVDHKSVAADLEFWALDGHGCRRKVKSLAGTWRNFVKKEAEEAEKNGRRKSNVERVEEQHEWLEKIARGEATWEEYGIGS